MATQLFVNFPTDDLPAAREFYAALGWTINPQFSDDNAICVVISDQNYAMVLRREFYDGFLKDTGKISGNPRTTSLAMVAFSLDSRAEVDAFIERARAAGAKIGKTEDMGFMYQRQFDDLDGNHWEPFFMDPSYVQ